MSRNHKKRAGSHIGTVCTPISSRTKCGGESSMSFRQWLGILAQRERSRQEVCSGSSQRTEMMPANHGSMSQQFGSTPAHWKKWLNKASWQRQHFTQKTHCSQMHSVVEPGVERCFVPTAKAPCLTKKPSMR